MASLTHRHVMIYQDSESSLAEDVCSYVTSYNNDKDRNERLWDFMQRRKTFKRWSRDDQVVVLFNAGGMQNQEASSTLHMRVSPSNFSGPVHLGMLDGHCFTNIIDSYKYELCPFANITQHEQSLRWNPYSGVLGVWQEWEIENNTFVAMTMSEGDSCGDLYRTTKVFLKCGEDNKIVSVTEPKTCHYALTFETPLVCHRHSLLVYPTLPSLLQKEWDLIEGRLLAQEITPKGYKRLLDKVFQKAGYKLATEAKKKQAEQAKENDAQTQAKQQPFETLYQCQTEYNKMKEEVESLRTLLQANGIQDNTQDKNPKDRNMGDLKNDYNHMDYEWMHGHADY